MQEEKPVTFKDVEKRKELENYLNKKFDTRFTNCINMILGTFQDEYIYVIYDVVKTSIIPTENRKFMSREYKSLSDQEIIDDVFAFTDFMQTFIDISTERLKNIDTEAWAKDFVSQYLADKDFQNYLEEHYGETYDNKSNKE